MFVYELWEINVLSVAQNMLQPELVTTSGHIIEILELINNVLELI
jgi:hypothetical protein